MSNNIFKKGDRVFHYDYGWGIIESISNTNMSAYPILVNFENSNYRCFTDDGRELFCEKPSLSFTKYTYTPEGFSQKRREDLPKRGDVVWVRDSEYDEWMISLFVHKKEKRYGVTDGNPFKSEVADLYFVHMITKNPYANE